MQAHTEHGESPMDGSDHLTLPDDITDIAESIWNHLPIPPQVPMDIVVHALMGEVAEVVIVIHVRKEGNRAQEEPLRENERGIDLNTRIQGPLGSSQLISGGSLSMVGPSRVRIGQALEYAVQMESIATTLRTLIGISNSWDSLSGGMHEEFLEWFRGKCEAQGQGGFVTPQPKQLIDVQLQRREEIMVSAKRQRSLLLLQSRNTPGQADREASSVARRENERSGLRGPFVFNQSTHSKI